MAKEAINRGVEVNRVTHHRFNGASLISDWNLPLPGWYEFCNGDREDVLCSGEIYYRYIPKCLQVTVGACICEPTSAPFSRSSPHGTDRRAWQLSWRRDPLATLESKLGVKLLPAFLCRVWARSASVLNADYFLTWRYVTHGLNGVFWLTRSRNENQMPPQFTYMYILYLLAWKWDSEVTLQTSSTASSCILRLILSQV